VPSWPHALHHVAFATPCSGQRLPLTTKSDVSSEPVPSGVRCGNSAAASSPNPQNPRGLKDARTPAPLPVEGSTPIESSPNAAKTTCPGAVTAFSRLGAVSISSTGAGGSLSGEERSRLGSASASGGVLGVASGVDTGASTISATTNVSGSSSDPQSPSPLTTRSPHARPSLVSWVTVATTRVRPLSSTPARRTRTMSPPAAPNTGRPKYASTPA
jgi:hypothetical protein